MRTFAKGDGVLLVGSVPLPDEETVFHKCSEWLPGRLVSVPDGEPAARNNYILFQNEIFAKFPYVLADLSTGNPFASEKAKEDLKDEQIQKAFETERMDVLYDRFALESYQHFKKFRDEKHLFNPSTRFQVSIPTPTNVIGIMIKPEYRVQLESFYTEGLYSALDNIQSSIPKQDLTIQIDMAVDVALLEGLLAIWWDSDRVSLYDGIINRAIGMASRINPEIPLGFHICYGDLGHRHFKEPVDLALVVKVAISIMRGAGRKIDYFHFPVPINRNDDEYFAPLGQLEKAKIELNQDTKIYLGLVHANDLEGSKKRIEAARKATKGDFGISTECGLGRVPAEDLKSVFDILRETSNPITESVNGQ